MYKKILVPLDGSELAECAIPHMEAIARGCEAPEIVLLRVTEPIYLPGDYVISDNDRQRMDAQHRSAAAGYLGELERRLGDDGLSLSSVVISGRVAESIVDYAGRNKADLIVMATHGRSGVSRLALGSVAERVLRLSCVPVLMVRAPGCVAGI
jgi:nucleotide-binding universal stress UspA family protein